jgi:pimeloyl-ACP methyl ester carboxylesterase
MKQIITSLSIFMLLASSLLGQLGHTTITFNDPLRTGGFGSGGGPGRQIQTEIYYPAATTGDDVPVNSGTFPTLIFGHGFFMSWEAYENIWEHYVALGYIVAFPRTEGGLAPSHSNFALDLNRVESSLQLLNTTGASLFGGKLSGNSAILGHSMGGGATLVAGPTIGSSVKAIVGMAPAETSPSAIAAAGTISVPSLIFSGAHDGVAPAATHQTPMYTALASSCKSFVSITGGAHCYFANSNAPCDFGEGTSSSGISITRIEQQQLTYSVLDPFLDFYLKGNCAGYITFMGLMNGTPAGLVTQSTCVTYGVPVISSSGNILSSSISGTVYQWFRDGIAILGATNPTFLFNQNGDYTVEVTFANGCSSTSLPFAVNLAATDESFLQNIQVYPNPSKGLFTISGLTEDLETIELVSMTGGTIKKIQKTNEMDISEFGKGIYFLKIRNQMLRLVVD